MSTANGTGIKYVGKADKRADGSYIATRWLTLFYVPLVPLGSARLHDAQRVSAVHGTVRTSHLTFRAETVALHRLQVLRTYACALVAAPVGWVALAYISAH